MVVDEDLLRRAELRVGTVLRGKYHIDRILGVGGMAVVYAATHRNQKRFAVKMLHPELSVRGDVRARFLREGYAANSVRHPGAVAVLDDDVAEDGAAFLVMELLEGTTVESLCEGRGTALPVRDALCITHQLLDVLDAAHAHAIVHRDIKPANLLVLSDGQLKVLDFGIARVRDVTASQPSTRTGSMLGTPAFMAPEQAMARSREIDAQTDLWAAGATLFTMISGRLVHEGENAQQILVRAATTRAPSLGSIAPQVAPAIVEIVAKALSFEKATRWHSAAAMRDALAIEYQRLFGESPSQRPLASLSADHTVNATAVRGLVTGAMPALRESDGAALGLATTAATTAKPVSSRRPIEGAAERPPRGRRLRPASAIVSAAALVLATVSALLYARSSGDGAAPEAAATAPSQTPPTLAAKTALPSSSAAPAASIASESPVTATPPASGARSTPIADAAAHAHVVSPLLAPSSRRDAEAAETAGPKTASPPRNPLDMTLK